MARYIDAEALKNDGHPCWHDGEGNIYYEADHAPTADVVEVKHGEWLDCIETGTTVAGIKVSGFVGYKCSLCGRYEIKREPYCNCGAKMDGGNAE